MSYNYSSEGPTRRAGEVRLKISFGRVVVVKASTSQEFRERVRTHGVKTGFAKPVPTDSTTWRTRGAFGWGSYPTRCPFEASPGGTKSSTDACRKFKLRLNTGRSPVVSTGSYWSREPSADVGGLGCSRMISTRCKHKPGSSTGKRQGHPLMGGPRRTLGDSNVGERCVL